MRYFAALLFLATFGCYSYRPVAAGHETVGQGIRVVLSDSGTTALAALLGPSTASVSGRMVASSPDAYLVAVRQTITRTGREADWAGEQVSIPTSLVAGIEGRHFSRRRTAVAATALAAAIVVVRDAFWGVGGVFGGGPPGGTPTPR